MNFPYNDYKLFCKVVATGHITEAAKKLHITQSALSYAIKRLEQYAGMPLLIRTKKGVLPTKDATKLLELAHHSFQTLEGVADKIHDHASSLKGQYLLGLHPSIALYTLKHFASQLTHKYPELSFSITGESSTKIAEAIIEGRIDLGIVTNPPEHPDLVIHKLADEVSTLWIHKSFPTSKRSDLALIQVSRQRQTKTIKKTLRAHGEEFPFKREISVQNFEIVKELVRQKVGAGILPYLTLSPLERKMLVPLNKNGPYFNENIYLIARYDQLKSPGLKLLFDQLKKLLKGLSKNKIPHV